MTEALKAKEFIQLEYGDWEEQFKPTSNMVEGGTNPRMDPDVQLYETFGPDLEFVRDQDINHVWTLLDCDGDLIIGNGYHIVNRLNYFITENPWPDNTDYEIVYSYDSRPYPVDWTGEGDNDGKPYGVEWRVYEKKLDNGEFDETTPYDVMDECWYETEERRDMELWD